MELHHSWFQARRRLISYFLTIPRSNHAKENLHFAPHGSSERPHSGLKTSVERGLRDAFGDRHPYSRTAVAFLWMFCKRLSCRRCEEAFFLICFEGAFGRHTCPGFVSMSTLLDSDGRAGSFSAPLLLAFIAVNSLMDSIVLVSVMRRETLGKSPYARKGKVVQSSQEVVRSTCLR